MSDPKNTSASSIDRHPSLEEMVETLAKFSAGLPIRKNSWMEQDKWMLKTGDQLIVGSFDGLKLEMALQPSPYKCVAVALEALFRCVGIGGRDE